jgi:hypothetical protein
VRMRTWPKSSRPLIASGLTVTTTGCVLVPPTCISGWSVSPWKCRTAPKPSHVLKDSRCRGRRPASASATTGSTLPADTSCTATTNAPWHPQPSPPDRATADPLPPSGPRNRPRPRPGRQAPHRHPRQLRRLAWHHRLRRLRPALLAQICRAQELYEPCNRPRHSCITCSVINLLASRSGCPVGVVPMGRPLRPLLLPGSR